MTTETAREVRLRCDCCDRQVMAVRRGNRLVIKHYKHGQSHVLTLDLTRFVEAGILKG